MRTNSRTGKFKWELIFILIALYAGGCGDNDMMVETENSDRIYVSVDTESVTINEGETIQLTAQVQDQDGNPITGEPVTWRSNDTAVAVVDSTGTITGIAHGNALIYAESGGDLAAVIVNVLWKQVAILNVSLDDDAGPLVRSFSIQVDGIEAVEIDYWTAASHRLRVRSEVPDSLHSLPIARLLPNSEYNYQVRTVGPDGLYGDPFEGTFTTRPLPPALEAVRFDARGTLTTPLVMIELRADFSGYVIVDQDGQIVWYWQTLGNGPQGSTRRANGNFVFIDRGRGLFEVSPEGNTVSTARGDFDHRLAHHDVISTPDNTLLFLTLDSQRVVNDTLWIGDRVWEWSPETGQIDLRWDTFDMYDIVHDRGSRSATTDWGHANALSIGPRGNILVSLHYLNQVISLTPDYQSFEWKLGGKESSFEISDDIYFSGQHTAAEIRSGRVLLFDNGFERINRNEYSRAMELELRFTDSTAAKAWEFRPWPDNYARVISSARRLPNGNTLVHFGTAVPIGGASTGGPIETFEVSEDGNVLWKLQISNAASAYRANPVTDLVGEFVVTDE